MQKELREKFRQDKIDELFASGTSYEDAINEADKWMKTQAVLHDPDQIAGGNSFNLKGLGDKNINSSIGAQWRYRIDDLEKQIKRKENNIMSMFNDFMEESQFDEETKRKIINVFPAELSDILIKYGSGSFLNGYLRIVNPFEYHEVIADTYFDAENSVPFMTTAFGDVIVYKKDGYIGIIKYKDNDCGIIGKKIPLFLRFLEDTGFRKINFDIPLYDEAIEKYGKLKYEECFGFVPLLPMGGKKDVAHLEKVNEKVHIGLITQLLGKIE